ncbi:MAG TPA: hypothetical protein VGW10_09110, partial [Solirubrobacteraceae bacterium]|nr:hypothetical protein [Solirubrobacteraceae bacterium]
MRALLGTAAVVVAASLAPAAAQAQLAVSVSHGPLISLDVVPMRTTGSLAVRWDSDPATCAAAGRCGLAGNMTWNAPRGGLVFVVEYLRNRRRERAGSLILSGEERGTPLRARVRRATPGGSSLCVDAASTGAGMELAERDGLVGIGFGQPGMETLLANRCAGPTMGDVASALPVIRMSLARLARGRTTIRLAGEGGFAAGGLRGTVTSTLSLRLGRPRTGLGDDDGDRITGGRRVRQIEVEYRVAEVRGEVGVDLAASADPAECAPLDACGLAGTLRLAPAVRQ